MINFLAISVDSARKVGKVEREIERERKKDKISALAHASHSDQ